MNRNLTKGSSINDVTVLKGRGQGFCDNSSKASVIKKRDDGGRRGKKRSKLHDIIMDVP
jgi:hypothetical protein